jgi:hypothetical protein
MHLHRIKGLDEEYLYFNDDIFPLKKCQPTDFFRSGKGVLGMSHHWLSCGMFKRICKNSDKLARKALGLKPSLRFLRPQHVCTPMLKSECEALYLAIESDIRNSLTRTRTDKNPCQYLFLDYMFFKGKIINERLSKKHFSVGVTSMKVLCKFISQPTHKLACINDVKLSEKRYHELRSALLNTLEERFPYMSKFER